MQITARVSPQKMKLIALRGAQMLQENMDAGIDEDGKPFAPYSTNTFARPLGGIPKRARELLDGAGKLTEFTAKSSGKLWALIEGGYKALKEAMYPGESDVVNFLASGRTRKALRTTFVGENAATLGYSTEEAAKIMYYLTIAGAGKGRTIRKLGWTKAQQEELAQMAAENIDISDFIL